ncbi:HlyD family efflux transporter periplasmic adaptor subunit [Selenomonas caprae]|uniref:HlyD family secretion protein n=2 Tax=Selenomonas TaxID=970 RepID=A0A1I3GHA3_SELRU|nr:MULTISPECIES: HlyD family efflux transporter periplasmic adaptor subunit [Selenomonas]TYZ29423.1 HlyD family efflux transporter periplasmic adaptor subunit [Selenomonas caprae]SFI22856.1 HlyD family secretion protein [Selenomonas ruminantium]
MNTKEKAKRTGILFIALLIIGGLVLMYTGNDALVLATEKKEGILTAEQVKLSFDSVGGRLVKEAVKEGDWVKKGDVIMELDATDTDLSIAKLKTQIAQMEAQIASASGTQGINYLKADTDESQNYRGIDQQQAAVQSASVTLKNARIDYDRKAALLEAGAIAQSQLDDAEMALNVAQANLEQQKQLLNKLTAATNGSGTDAIAQERLAAANMANDVEALRQQKAALEVQLKELEVAKERLTLRAPEDGKILKVLAKEGEMISPSTPVVLLESSRSYYDIYVSEKQAAHLAEGKVITGTTVAGEKEVTGTIRLLAQAPGFADLKNSREKGQSDLSAFQVRIYIDKQEGVIPGMTIEVKDSEFTKR